MKRIRTSEGIAAQPAAPVGSPKRGRGRPPLGADKRGSVVRVLVTEAEREVIKAAAKREDSTVSDWGRPVLIAAADSKR